MESLDREDGLVIAPLGAGAHVQSVEFVAVTAMTAVTVRSGGQLKTGGAVSPLSSFFSFDSFDIRTNFWVCVVCCCFFYTVQRSRALDQTLSRKSDLVHNIL